MVGCLLFGVRSCSLLVVCCCVLLMIVAVLCRLSVVVQRSVCAVMVCRCLSVLVDVLGGACCLLFAVLMYLINVVPSFLMLQFIVVGVCGWFVSFVDACR